MTDRRPHWDDDLVEAVRSKIGIHQHGPIGEIRIYNPFDDEVYNVIAAVEDWQCDEHEQAMRELRGWQDAAASYRLRAEKAEAAIARVRELCEQTTVSVSIGCRCYTDECSGTCGAGRPLSWHLNPAAVLAVLDGDSDE